MPLTTEQIKELLNKEQKRVAGFQTPQVGPLKWTGNECRCAKRGCGVMTHYSVQGVPRCTIHALEEMNEMLVAQGFRGVVYKVTSKSTAIPVSRITTASVHAYLEMGWALGKFECIHGIKLDKDCNACNSG